jgi:hypothetical protein
MAVPPRATARKVHVFLFWVLYFTPSHLLCLQHRGKWKRAKAAGHAACTYRKLFYSAAAAASTRDATAPAPFAAVGLVVLSLALPPLAALPLVTEYSCPSAVPPPPNRGQFGPAWSRTTPVLAPTSYKHIHRFFFDMGASPQPLHQ